MLFPTPTFAIFFTLVFALAWAWREHQNARKYMLLVASYAFYGWWDWRFCLLLFGASVIAWITGLLLFRTMNGTLQRWIVGIACILLLGVLAFFKYYGFFLSSLQDVLFATGLERDLPFLQIILPVGISFFTFQAISYVVDVYRGDVAIRKSPLDVLLYISFFPQLVAGPIVRASDFLPQLQTKAELTKSMACTGIVLCILGLFKKMVIASYLATDIVDPVFLDPGSFSSVMVLLGVYGYAVQIYCDFSGYSDIAIGTALLLGFRFRANFNQPYRATSLQDFWRRWHMSLSQWLRDYLYIPLGGSLKGIRKTYRNLFITMFLGGLWHGAAWNFIIWGSLHGAWLVIERAYGVGHSDDRSALKSLLGWFITFHIVCVGWIFFRASDLGAAFTLFGTLTEATSSVEGLTWFTLALIFGTLLSQFTPAQSANRLASVLERGPFIITMLVLIVGLIVTVWLSPPGTAPFIYFQF